MQDSKRTLAPMIIIAFANRNCCSVFCKALHASGGFCFIFAPSMKIFAVIFAFYMVVLSLAPCCDRYEQAGSPQTLQQSQDRHEQENEFCSPFCQCSCC